MNAHLHSVPDADAEEALVAEDAPLEGGASSFESFFSAERKRLFGALVLVTGNRYEAEEIMQEAFLRIWERWDRVSVMDRPTGFLYRTAMNVFRNRTRRATLALRRVVQAAPVEDVFSTVDDRDAVVRALRELTPKQRAAIVLTAYGGLTSEEAAGALGLKPVSVRALANRARAELRLKEGELR
jgi:RNA polymerase sigma-70 factor (ECF subfamily)